MTAYWKRCKIEHNPLYGLYHVSHGDGYSLGEFLTLSRAIEAIEKSK